MQILILVCTLATIVHKKSRTLYAYKFYTWLQVYLYSRTHTFLTISKPYKVLITRPLSQEEHHARRSMVSYLRAPAKHHMHGCMRFADGLQRDGSGDCQPATLGHVNLDTVHSLPIEALDQCAEHQSYDPYSLVPNGISTRSSVLPS